MTTGAKRLLIAAAVVLLLVLILLMSPFHLMASRGGGAPSAPPALPTPPAPPAPPTPPAPPAPPLYQYCIRGVCSPTDQGIGGLYPFTDPSDCASLCPSACAGLACGYIGGIHCGNCESWGTDYSCSNGTCVKTSREGS